MDGWQDDSPMPPMDVDMDTTDEASSVSTGPLRPRDWSQAPIFHKTKQHSLADLTTDLISRIHLNDPVVEVPNPPTVNYVIQRMYGTKGQDRPLRSQREAQQWPSLLKDHPTNMRATATSPGGQAKPPKGYHIPTSSRLRNVDEMPKPGRSTDPAGRYELRYASLTQGVQPDQLIAQPLEERHDSEDLDELADDSDSDVYIPGARRPPKRKARPAESAPNPFRDKEGVRYQSAKITVRFADYERRIMRDNSSFAARKALLAQTHQGLKIEPIGGNVARVVMCGFMKPGDPTMTCGIYTTKTYDLIRHRVAHLYYECLVSELDQVPDGGGLVFGGFHVELPTCPTCGKTFTRYDSLQRHGKRTDTACFAPNYNRYNGERMDRERRIEVVRRELEKNMCMQYWIKTPQPLPKTVKAKVGIRNGGPGLGSCVLEIMNVEETYAAKYEFTTVKEGKELQVRLLDHGEPGGIPFYRPMKGSYDPNPNGKGLVLPDGQ